MSSQPTARPIAVTASTPANASAAASAGLPAFRAGPEVPVNTWTAVRATAALSASVTASFWATGSIAAST